jgi:hypothetical protein
LLGVDLGTVGELADSVEPYVRVDGTKVWSLMQLERQLRRSADGEAATSTADGPRPPTRKRCPPRSPTFGTTIRIAHMHHPSCLS